MTNLPNRVSRLETLALKGAPVSRSVLRVIARKGEEDAAIERLRQEGHDPDAAFVVMRVIISPGEAAINRGL